MAYGDDRQEVANDPFTSSIDSNWNNGFSSWPTPGFTFISANLIGGVSTGISYCMARITSEDYSAGDDQTLSGYRDQYSRVTIAAYGTGGNEGADAAILAQNTGSQQAVFAGVEWGPAYRIYLVEDTDTYTELVGATVTSDAAAGTIVTIESIGDEVRMGTKVGAGADTEQLAGGDLSGTGGQAGSDGQPGVVLYSDTGTTYSNWSGGYIGPPPAGGGSVPAMLQNQVRTGFWPPAFLAVSILLNKLITNVRQSRRKFLRFWS